MNFRIFFHLAPSDLNGYAGISDLAPRAAAIFPPIAVRVNVENSYLSGRPSPPVVEVGNLKPAPKGVLILRHLWHA
jgi:hypothetical protein